MLNQEDNYSRGKLAGEYFDYFGDFYENHRVNYKVIGKDNPVYSDTPIDETIFARAIIAVFAVE